MSVTLGEAIARLKEFDRRGLHDATAQALYRSLDLGRRRAIDTLKRTTIGKMVARRGQVQLQLGLSSSKKLSAGQLAGLASSTIPLIVRRLKVEKGISGTSVSFRGGLETMGFAALIETGGRTKSHQIKRIRLGGYSRRRTKRAAQVDALPPMTFQVGGRWVSKRIVTHPGSRVPRNPFMQSGTAAAGAALPVEFERAIVAQVARARL